MKPVTFFVPGVKKEQIYYFLAYRKTMLMGIMTRGNW